MAGRTGLTASGACAEMLVRPEFPADVARIRAITETAFAASSHGHHGEADLMSIIIETDRLLLRTVSLDDAGAFYALNSNPEVVRYTGGDSLGSVEEAGQGIRERILRDYAVHGFGRWAMILKETGELIGLAGLKHLDDLNEVDLGYRMLPKYWGRGLATEAAGACIAYGFDVLRLPRIIGLVDPPNVASARVLEKSGLVFEAMVEYRSQQVAKYVIAGAAHRPR